MRMKMKRKAENEREKVVNPSEEEWQPDHAQKIELDRNEVKR